MHVQAERRLLQKTQLEVQWPVSTSLNQALSCLKTSSTLVTECASPDTDFILTGLLIVPPGAHAGTQSEMRTAGDGTGMLIVREKPRRNAVAETETGIATVRGRGSWRRNAAGGTGSAAADGRRMRAAAAAATARAPAAAGPPAALAAAAAPVGTATGRAAAATHATAGP